MPFVNGRIVLNSWVTAVPCALGHPVQNVLGLVGWRFDLAFITDPTRLPNLVVRYRRHELIGQSNRQIGILEHDGRVRFAIEICFVSLTDQGVSLLLFLPLALNEFHDVRVPDFDRLHFGSPSRLATRFYNGGDLIVDSHE